MRHIEIRKRPGQPEECRALIELRGAPDEAGRFEGYASAFGVVDSYGDVMEPGCFAASLATWAQRSQKLPILWQHDYTQPIGYADPAEMVEDERGLRVVGHLVAGVRQAEEAKALMAAGALGGLSIGFTVRTSERKKAFDGVQRRHITALDLYEFSPVTWPANGGAVITDVRQAEKRGTFGEELDQEEARDALWRRRWAIENTMWKVCMAALSDQGVEQAERMARVDACLQEAAGAWSEWFAEFAVLYADELAEERGAFGPALLRHTPTVIRAGKVLSATNREKVQTAYDALGALLAAADGETAAPGPAIIHALRERGATGGESPTPSPDPAEDDRIIQELRDAHALQQLQAATRPRREA